MGQVIRKGERFHQLPSAGADVDRLRGLLADWQDWSFRANAKTGRLPNAVAYVDSMLPSVSDSFGVPLDDYLTTDTATMRALDTAIEADLPRAYPGGRELLHWRYLNVSVGATVFRLKRLEGKSLIELDGEADKAELALLEIARRRNLL